MSVVWRGYDTVLERSVAVKVLASTGAEDPGFRQSIQTEARAAARLSHPNVTAVFDYGESVDDSGERVPYVVMELLGGRLLTERLAEGPLPPSVGLRVCAQVAGALAAAHAQGLVHRDIKPGNVMLTPHGAKVFDFGIAAPVGRLDDADTEGAVLGTAAYLAPERLLGAPVTTASDVYALGLLIFRVLTNRLPWSAETATEMMLAHAYAEPATLPDLAQVPREIRELVRRCLAKEGIDRPTAAEATAILAAAAGITVPVGDGEDTGPTAPSELPTRRPGASKALGLAAVAAVLVTVGLVAPLFRGGPTTPARADDGPAAGTTPTRTPTTGIGAGPTPSRSVPVLVTGPAPPIGPTGRPPSATTTLGVPTSRPAPTEAPTAAPTSSPPATFTSAGGTVVAVCIDGLAYLESWSPESAYKVEKLHRGPADKASLRFHAEHGPHVDVSVECSTGEPVFTASD